MKTDSVICKKIIKRTAFIVCIVVFALLMSWKINNYIAKKNTANYFYTVNADGKTCTVTGVKSGIGAGNLGLYIPDTIDGYSVTEIAPYAFKGNEIVKNVRFPSNLKVIGTEAFYGCKNLRKLIIDGNIVALGDNICGDCSAMTYVLFCGSIDDWSRIKSSEASFDTDILYFYSESKPDTYGNFWYGTENHVKFWRTDG